MMKEYEVTVVLSVECVSVSASNEEEAKEKARQAIAGDYGSDVADDATYSVEEVA